MRSGTILRLRAGMTMLRMPVFCWTMLVTCLMVVMTFPVLIAAMAMVLADRHGAGIFDGSSRPISFQNLFWTNHPVVYVWFFRSSGWSPRSSRCSRAGACGAIAR